MVPQSERRAVETIAEGPLIEFQQARRRTRGNLRRRYILVSF